MLVLVGESIFGNNIRFLCFVSLEPAVECFYHFYDALLRVSEEKKKKSYRHEAVVFALK